MISQLKKIRQVFLDMDGTIYHGSILFPTTKPFLGYLTAQGIGYRFLSNNSSYSTQEYVERLAEMGIKTTAENFYISTDYAIDYLKTFHPEIKKLYILGMRSIFPAFTEAGFEIDENAPDAVIVAFDRDLVYDRLCRASWFIHRGVPGFATHPDLFCPTDLPTRLVDCGAITSAVELATGKKLKVLGKPDPGMLRCAAARCGVSTDEVMMVGDRLATDIAIGVNAKTLTCWISDSATPAKYPPGIRPTCRVRDLGELQKIFEEAR